MAKKTQITAAEIDLALRSVNGGTTADAATLELGKKVLKTLNRLDERKRKVIAMRYGVDGEAPKTLQAIGNLYNLTRERIRQIQNLALQDLCDVAQ